jgi:hypothetical protein
MMVFASNTHKKLYQEIEQLNYEISCLEYQLRANPTKMQIIRDLTEKNSRGAFLSSLFAQHYSETDLIYWIVAGAEEFYDHLIK